MKDDIRIPFEKMYLNEWDPNKLTGKFAASSTMDAAVKKPYGLALVYYEGDGDRIQSGAALVYVRDRTDVNTVFRTQTRIPLEWIRAIVTHDSSSTQARFGHEFSLGSIHNLTNTPQLIEQFPILKGDIAMSNFASGSLPNKNTKAYTAYTPIGTFYFSYETCIAFKPDNAPGVRVENQWGPTTGRHFDDLGCGGFKVVSSKELDKLISLQLPHQRHPGALMIASRIMSGEIEAGPLEKLWAAAATGQAAEDAKEDDIWVDLATFTGDKS
jgi:hypothetical protein